METNSFFRIRVNAITPERPLPFDLFIMINGRYVHYLRLGDKLSNEKIAQLGKADVFYIPETQRPAFKTFIFERMNESDLNVVQKANVLRESSLALAEEIFEQPDVRRALDESKEIINQFIQFIEKEPEGMAHLISLSSHDFYTYNHSLDVSVYSLGLGKALGYSQADLAELGRGALFHDIGKRQVHVDIICKKGPLNDTEWAQMQKHPQYGLKILTDYNCSEAMRACCFEHHESFAGEGYPQQINGHEIHPMARIVAITDTYDALTTKRSYNVPMKPTEALEFMKNKLAGRYDPDMLEAMYSVLFKLKKSS